VNHKLDLFDSSQIEQKNLQFCKKALGVRQQTQTNFVYGELGETSLNIW